MVLQLADVTNEYTKNKNLKKEDVQALMDWTRKQPHLPEINELQVILFLQSCYFKSEAAKNVLDKYFTIKTLCSYLFRGKTPVSPSLRKTLDNSFGAILPQKTPEGYRILFFKLIHLNPENFNFVEHVKYFDMICTLQLYQEGSSEGYVIIVDMEGAVIGHLMKVIMLGPAVVKNFLLYVQEALPVRLKTLHFINIVPFIDKLMTLIKPFLKTEILEILYFHDNLEGLLKFVPLETLPKDYGGCDEDMATLHEGVKNRLLENAAFFEWEDQHLVDETKRQSKLTNLEDIVGIEGTFKKLELD